MDAAISYATAKGTTAVTLTTFRDLVFNEKFYQKLGFQTLGTDELTPRLQDILGSEAENGLPAERRCAMRLDLV